MRQCLILALILLFSTSAHGKDMRAASQKAKADYEAAIAEAKSSEQRILNDRASLEKEVKLLLMRVKKLKADITSMENECKNLSKKEVELSNQKSVDEMSIRELTGTVRVVARDLETLLKQSPFTARFPERLDRLEPVLKKDRFPGIDDFKVISDLFFEEMRLSGEVIFYKGSFVGRSGVKQEGDILSIGKFTSAYKTQTETGFLNYSEGGNELITLSALPSRIIRHNIEKYMEGEAEDIYLDFSGGAALRQITHKLNLWEKIQSGGPIVWPILGIAFLALILVLERTLFLHRVHARTDTVMGKVNELASKGKWSECRDLLKKKKGGPVYNVLISGLAGRGEDRETLESILQESILRELPRLERFLPTLNILAAIAPLLGLLGTVTGMINTFHVITLYGTGDPRMMSGGISEALVTTMLGLAVAIPIMLMHTFLSRRVDHITGDMEEKAVALTNTILISDRAYNGYNTRCL
jgi:biopolymer transport protein ExbB